MAHPLHIQFCERIVRIQGADPTLHRLLSRYFRHCLATNETTAPAAVYHIVEQDNQWQVWFKDKLIHAAPEPFYIFMFLTRSVTAKLVTGCENHLVFHAAGLAAQDHGLILCGQSNSGKSTLTAWLTASGFGYLADDLIAVDCAPFALKGLTCPLVLKDGSKFVWQRWLPTEVVDQEVDFFGGTAWIDPDLLAPGCVRRTVEPRLLIFPEYQAGQPLTVHRLTAAEAAFRLLPRLINFANFPDRGFAQVTQLVRHITVYHLVHADVAAAAAWVEQTMAALADV